MCVRCEVCEGVILVQLEKRRADEKSEKDRLNRIYMELVEKQRSYYKTARDFHEVC